MMMKRMKNFCFGEHVKSNGRMYLIGFSPLVCIRIKVSSIRQHNIHCGKNQSEYMSDSKTSIELE